MSSDLSGGVVVDWVDRKRLIVLGDLARATIYGSAALAWRLGALTPPVLLVVAAASGACAGVFGLASNAMIKHVVPPDRYPSAQAANQARESALSIASNPAGGALMSVSPAAPFFAEAAGHGDGTRGDHAGPKGPLVRRHRRLRVNALR